jgi:HEPN domain-containing protein
MTPHADQASAIIEAERLILHALDAFQAGAQNISAKEVVKKIQFKENLQQTGWHMFVQRADSAYFVARTLFDQHMFHYGLFCAQQCVEIYLKAFVHKVGVAVPDWHGLVELLDLARRHSPSDNFLHTRFAEAICLRFDPFYESPRYPVQNKRPAGGGWSWASGIDIQFLDYFVFRMRQTFGDSHGLLDILSDDHGELHIVALIRPELLQRFKEGNINYMR